MAQWSWPYVQSINQKNYYTEYLKKDEQTTAYRQMMEEKREEEEPQVDADGDLELLDADQAADDFAQRQKKKPGQKCIVIHPGSQNLRIGRASDALPKSIPNVIARQSEKSESELHPAAPKRNMLQLDDEEEPEVDWEHPFGADFEEELRGMSQALKQRMRSNKRKMQINSKDLVTSYNNRQSPDIIKEHNDPHRVEWTEVSKNDPPKFFVGQEALTIPDDSTPRYKLTWPIRHGWFNEKEYSSKRRLWEDISDILEYALKNLLGIERSDIAHEKYTAVLVIPDLYEKVYVEQMVDILFRDFFFDQVCIFQESSAATYGSGILQACIIDIGAQKTSVCCLEDGICIPESR